jgi:type IV fimbrial biogenesis protein FimT
LPFVAAPNAPVGRAAGANSALPIVQAMKRAQAGFTLMDLLTTLTVLGILMAVGIPSFSSVIRNNRITAHTNELVTALTFARSEAMKRGDVVTTCPSTDGEACEGSNDWSTGWFVFVDANADGARDVDEEQLQVWPAIEDVLTLVSDPMQFVQYAPTGLTVPVITDQTFELMQPGFDDELARCIRLGNTGRIFTERNACP